jgi:hypothetical protein
VDQVAYWPKPGHVRIEGVFLLVDGKWQWQEGRWESEREGQIYRDAAWAQHGNRWYFMEGGWEDARAGHVRVRGRWEQREGKLVWVPGYWQPERPGFVWRDGHWRNHGQKKLFELGRWEADSGAQTARTQLGTQAETPSQSPRPKR